jgi:hypothetical protein
MPMRTSTRVSAPTRSGTIFARISSWQGWLYFCVVNFAGQRVGSLRGLAVLAGLPGSYGSRISSSSIFRIGAGSPPMMAAEAATLRSASRCCQSRA